MAGILPPLARHISAVKRRLIVIGITLLASFVLTFAYAPDLVAWLKRPFQDDLIFYGPTEALFASLKVSLLAGVILSMPVILYQCWKFVEPALLPKEQRWAIPLFALAAGFFALGLVFCNLVILPLVIHFFVSFGMDRELTPQLAVGTYIDFNVKFLLVFGFAFELPLALTLLARIGVLSSRVLASYRKHAIMVALIAMLLMAVPLIILYEIGIWGARFFGKQPSQNQNEPGMNLKGITPVGTAGHRVR